LKYFQREPEVDVNIATWLRNKVRELTMYWRKKVFTSICLTLRTAEHRAGTGTRYFEFYLGFDDMLLTLFFYLTYKIYGDKMLMLDFS